MSYVYAHSRKRTRMVLLGCGSKPRTCRHDQGSTARQTSIPQYKSSKLHCYMWLQNLRTCEYVNVIYMVYTNNNTNTIPNVSLEETNVLRTSGTNKMYVTVPCSPLSANPVSVIAQHRRLMGNPTSIYQLGSALRPWFNQQTDPTVEDTNWYGYTLYCRCNVHTIHFERPLSHLPFYFFRVLGTVSLYVLPPQTPRNTIVQTFCISLYGCKLLCVNTMTLLGDSSLINVVCTDH